MATATFESLNPSTGEVIDSFPRSTAEDVDRAVATARAAWEEWRLVPAPERGNILFRFAQVLERSKPELSDLMTREMGKVKAEAGARLVRHPDVPVITFTGSRETGVLVTKNAADQLKHVHLELGGKNAIIVMDDADLDLAVDGIVWSAFGTAGQRCTAASRVIVHRAVYDALQSKLVARAEEMRIGAPWEDDTDIGPVINETAVEKIHSYTEIGKGEGAKLLTGGERVEGHGFYYRPTVFADVEPAMRIAQEEIFGPTTALIPVDSFEAAVAAANSVKYGLSSSIVTRDGEKAFKPVPDPQT